MGIKDRLKFIAKSYINSFLDQRRPPTVTDGEPEIKFDEDEDLKPTSDADFEKQWEAYQREQSTYRAQERKRQQDQARNDPPPRHRSGERTLEQCYQNLDCPVGADLKTVRVHFRKMMKKFHPDLHVENKRNQEAATRISQIITECYQQLEKHLEAKGQR